MTMLASQITNLMVVYSIVYSGVNQRKHQSSASLAFVREIHRGPVNFPHKWLVTRKMFPFDDVIMWYTKCTSRHSNWPNYVQEALGSRQPITISIKTTHHMKYWGHKIGDFKYCIALKFYKLPRRSAAEAPVKFRSDRTIPTSHHSASSPCEILR